MLKNRAIQMTLVKNPQNQTTDTKEQKPFMTPDEAHSIAKDMIKRTALAVVGVMAAAAVLHTASEIAIQNTTPND